MSQEAPRPGQATLAGWLIIGGSVVVVATAWQRISTLHTLEVQEQLQRVLSEPGLDGLGMSVSTLSETIRILCMVAAAAATASAILGFHALRRSTSARLALSILAPLIAIGGFATSGGFFAPMVVAGVVMLWLRPTRDWFAGRPWVAERAGREDADARQRKPDPFAVPPHQPAPSPSAPPAPSAPTAPSTPPSDHAGPPAWQGTFGQPAPAEAPQPAGAAGAVPGKRPGRLIAACVIVWVSSLFVAGMMALTALVLLTVPDELFDEAQRQGVSLQGMSRDELTTAALVMAAISIVWSIAAAVLAWLTFNRVGWARLALLVCSAVVGLLMLVMAVAAPYLVVLVAAAAVTCAFLARREVAAWFRR